MNLTRRSFFALLSSGLTAALASAMPRHGIQRNDLSQYWIVNGTKIPDYKLADGSLCTSFLNADSERIYGRSKGQPQRPKTSDNLHEWINDPLTPIPQSEFDREIIKKWHTYDRIMSETPCVVINPHK